MEIRIRKAVPADVPAIAAIYEAIHTEEEQGRLTIGWQRGVYPTAQTAAEAVARGDMFVLEAEGRIAASARINREQGDAYAEARWRYPAPPEQVMVLHTLTVSPPEARRGHARRFLAFYEDYARRNGCPFLRMDTNEKNAVARRFYARHGYREADVVPCVFNGIPGVRLVCLEKDPETV